MSSQSGPLSDYYLPQMVSFLKSDSILASQEFKDLDSKTQQFIRTESRPFYEIMSVSHELLFFHMSMEEYHSNISEVPCIFQRVTRTLNRLCILILKL